MISLDTLGKLSISVDGTSIRLATKKHAALLIYLAAHVDRIVRREQLARLLWSRSPLPRARHSLSQAIYAIRKQLPVDYILVTNAGMSIPAKHVSADFLMLRAAYEEARYLDVTRLYKGDFLDGFWVPDATDFEHWQEAECGSLRQMAYNAMSHLLMEAERGRNWIEVERLASRILSLNPYAEEVHRVRIEALVASGNRILASDVLERALDMYRDQYGDAPASLKNMAIGGRANVHPITRVASSDDECIKGIPFVGRRKEFRQLRDVWDGVRAGNGRVLILSGEPGIGKSRLGERIVRLAAIQGARCFQGRCHSLESQTPYSGFVDALSDQLGPRDILNLPDQWRDILSHYIPALIQDSDRQAKSFERDFGRRPLIEAFVQLIRHMAIERPLVVFIDDFHWADDSTIELINHLSRRISDMPVMLLVALRREELTGRPQLRRFVYNLSQVIDIEEIRVPEMSIEDVVELVAVYGESYQYDVPNDLGERLYDLVGGRPFYVIEYLHAYRNDPSTFVTRDFDWSIRNSQKLPPAIRDYVAFRLLELNELEVRLVGSLAVLGYAAPLDVVCKVGGVPTIRAIGGIAGLIQRGIVVEKSDGIAFAHDIIRDAVYQWVDGPTRRLLHRRAADIMASDDSPAVGAIAHHYDLAGDRARAFEYAIAAATSSGKLHGLVETEYYLQMALANAVREKDRLKVHEQLAHFYYRNRRYVEAEQHFAQLDDCYCMENNIAGALMIEVSRISAALSNGTLSAIESVKRLQECVSVAERLQDVSLVCDVLRKLGSAAHSIGDRVTVLGVAEKLLEHTNKITNPKERIRNLCISADIVGLYRSVAEGLAISENAYREVQSIDDLSVHIAVLRSRANNRFQSGRLEDARSDIDRAMAIAQQLGMFGGRNDLWVTAAVIALESGEYDSSEQILQNAMRVASDRHAIHEMLPCKANYMLLQLERGNIDHANELAIEILEQNRVPAVWWCGVTAWAVRGEYALQRADFAEASRCRREVKLRLEGRMSWVLDISYVESFLARMAVIDGDLTMVLDRLERAIRSYETRDVFCRARLQLQRAEVIRNIDPSRAIEQATEVWEFAAKIGARPLIARAESLIR